MDAMRWASTACLLVSCGCAATTAEKKAQAEPSTMLVCQMERPTGSMIRKRVCRTQEVTERDRRDADEIMKKGRVQIEKSN